MDVNPHKEQLRVKPTSSHFTAFHTDIECALCGPLAILVFNPWNFSPPEPIGIATGLIVWGVAWIFAISGARRGVVYHE
jgi:hypothetical protein